MVKQTKKRGASLLRAGHDPRAAALVLLLQVLDEGQDSPAALDTLLDTSQMVPTDKRLCTTLAYGTLRQYLRVEWFLLRFLEKPEKLPREMYVCLIMTFYSMAFLRIPHHAGVGWAVSHVRNRFGEGLSRVANGVLRAAQRQLKSFQNMEFYEQELGDAAKAAALWAGIPFWMADLWQKGYGAEACTCLLEAVQQQAPSGVRLNRAQPDWENGKSALLALAQEGQHVHALLPDGGVQVLVEADDLIEDLSVPRKKRKTAPEPLLVVEPCGVAFSGTLPWEARRMQKTGKASLQSVASYAVLEALQPQSWPGPVWDVCSGRGGKTLALLEMGVPVVLASDPSQGRIGALPAECARLGFSHESMPFCVGASAEQIVADMENRTGMTTVQGAAVPDLSLFGSILVDAPCSGFGTLSRRPEIRLRRKPEDVSGLVRTQAAILDAVVNRLQPGGLLVYLTCTVNPAENEEQVRAFMVRHGHMRLEREYHTPWKTPLREFFYAALLRCQKE